MASLKYLWQNKANFKFCSIDYFRAWGKRIKSFPELLIRNLKRSELVRKGAVINDTAEIGNVFVGGHKNLLSIGRFSFLGKVNIALHDRVTIGDYVCINDGVEILTASHDSSDPEWKHIKRPILIDDYSWICTGAIILPGVHIGKGAVVGAGAVVSKDVAGGQIVVGNPAMPISKKRAKDLCYNPCEFLAANQAWLLG